MNNVIHLLPDSVANQIAAGEVIQRPAAVIKELVENSVDAGADHIRIIIKDAGRTLIQVIDNGKGMNEIDVRMAFERHATSKITCADDLFKLTTMGFRGEALPSICAISQIEVKTRTEEETLGTRLLINCSKVESQEPCVCEKGTNIMVRNIFCNLPARRRFLKSDTVELSNIMREFERLALVNNHLHLSIDTGSKVIDLPKASFKQRIGDIWKNNLNMHLIPIDVDSSVAKITGFVSHPEFARRRNPLQYLIVNGRNMRHPCFNRAILLPYSKLIAADMQPCYFLKFEVDPSTIDVNIHPTKNEIKFENEQEIWTLLMSAVRTALGRNQAVPSIDFEADALPVNLHPGANAGRDPFQQEDAKTPKPPQIVDTNTRSHSSDWGKLYQDFLHSVSQNGEGAQAGMQPPAPLPQLMDEAPQRQCLQYGLKYIVTEAPDGLMIIDQHRAHVRILYEKFMAKTNPGENATQGLLFAEELELDPAQHLTLEGILPQITRLGFDISHIDGYTWRISGIPATAEKTDVKDMICRILDSISDDSLNYGKQQSAEASMLEKVALVTARAAAITGGRRLTQDEMNRLVTDLLNCESPGLTPNGNPIYTTINENKFP